MAPHGASEPVREKTDVARLHEYQGKALLKERGVEIPAGRAVATREQARETARELGGRVVVKVQAWTTGRAALGGVAFADTPDEAGEQAARMLGMEIGAFVVDELLVEQAIDIEQELFISLSIDDAARSPVLLLSLSGGSGVEDRAGEVKRVPVDVRSGVDAALLADHLNASSVDASMHKKMIDAINAIVRTAKEVEARSLEVNPLAVTKDGRVVAADCRITIDDYAVFRHPNLGIDIARELDHPPTELERIAYRIEQSDHRGTFYFARLPVETQDRGNMIAFHGAGGGGSMMSMDAVSRAGFAPANFTDTSGNPSAAKVYAAARIMLAQEGVVGYFGSGSGVASQEQFWSAYGLAKAFLELGLDIPAVIRLGGNSEDRAVEILEDACRELPADVRGFRKDDSPARCAEVFAELVQRNDRAAWTPRQRRLPVYVGSEMADSFPIQFAGEGGGRVWIDHSRCTQEVTDLVVRHSGGVLEEREGLPLLAVSEQDASKMDSELIACEIECRRAGHDVVFVALPIPGIDTPGPHGIAEAAASGDTKGAS